MTTLFISDLHLTPERSDITDCFLRFMKNEAIHADALYVLGDLFETWFGDDDNSPFNQQIKSAFKALTSAGVACYFIEGNRDFLVGKQFGKETGVTILPEICTIDLYGTKTLIMHGDTLCTLDEGYQKYRATVHKPWVQWLFLHLPLKWRHKVVGNIKSSSKDQKEQKQMTIMDVTPDEVVKVLEQYKTNLIIHGHTHRPALHSVQLKEKVAQRIVLGDWYEQGSVLVCTEESKSLESRNFMI